MKIETSSVILSTKNFLCYHNTQESSRIEAGCRLRRIANVNIGSKSEQQLHRNAFETQLFIESDVTTAIFSSFSIHRESHSIQPTLDASTVNQTRMNFPLAIKIAARFQCRLSEPKG